MRFNDRIKGYIPAPLLRPFLTWRSKRRARLIVANRAQPGEVFTHIFSTNVWRSGESVSGPGSELGATANVREALPRIVRQYKIGSMLDAPCGDFHWMQLVELGNTRYVGGDIVKEIVDANTTRYAGPNRRFIHLDLAKDELPKVDLIFCRDCFIHFPFQMILGALANFRRSEARYLITTTYPNWPVNYDTLLGGFRGVNMLLWPFGLPKAIEMIQEDQSASDGAYFRCMGLWDLQPQS